MTDTLKQELLSEDKQHILLFSLAPAESDHPTERVGAYLGVHTVTLANWRNEGKGPKFRKRAGRILYRKQDVLDWINEAPAVSSLLELSQRAAGHLPLAAIPSAHAPARG